MKKILSILFIISVIIICNACVKAKKNVNDYFVKVKTASAVVRDDGSVLVTAEIESEGGAPVENIGFSCGTSANHKLTSRQIDGNGNSGGFTGVFENLSDDSTYYFRAFATNAYGYSRGEAVALSGIKPVPVVPTCTFVIGYLYTDAFSTETNLSFSNFNNSLGVYESYGSASFTNVTVRFLGVPKTGLYTTEQNYTPSGSKNVFVSFTRSSISGSVLSGAPVYVNEISPGLFDVYICNGFWMYNTSTYAFKTHFQVSL
jgi:hypothetical protein